MNYLQQLSDFFKSKTFGYFSTLGVIAWRAKGFSAAVFTGGMGSIGGLAVGSALLFGVVPFLASIAWYNFWSGI